MKELRISNRTIPVDDEGYLMHQHDWDAEVAKKLAQNLGIETLSDEQLEIVSFLRSYYKKHQAFPILNYVCTYVDQERGCLNNEFVNPMNAWKIAGLPPMDGIHFVTVDGKNYQLEECC